MYKLRLSQSKTNYQIIIGHKNIRRDFIPLQRSFSSEMCHSRATFLCGSWRAAAFGGGGARGAAGRTPRGGRASPARRGASLP